MGVQIIEDSPNIVIVIQILMNHATFQNDFRRTVILKNLDLAKCVQFIRNSPYIVTVMFVQILMRSHKFYWALQLLELLLQNPFHIIKKCAFLMHKKAEILLQWMKSYYENALSKGIQMAIKFLNLKNLKKILMHFNAQNDK